MLQFSPPLSSLVSVSVPSTLFPGSRLRWHATLSQKDYVKLRDAGTRVQVWGDICGTGEWSETTFEEHAEPDKTNDTMQPVDLSLAEPAVNLETSRDQVCLEATVPLSPLVGQTIEFTYRLAHASSSVSWLGSEATNGRIAIEKVERSDYLKAEDWSRDDDGVFSWKAGVAHKPVVVVAKLSSDVNWRGWAIGKEGPSRFTAVSSAVTERVVLALLPETGSDGYVIFQPILFTSQNATLSLAENGEILFHAGDDDSSLRAFVSTQTWKNHIGDGAINLDLQTSDLLGISITGEPHVSHINLLPVAISRTIAMLNSSDVTSLVSTSSLVAIFDPGSHAVKFLSTSSPTHHLRVAVGPTGAEILVAPGYSLASETCLAFLPYDRGATPAVRLDVKPDNSPELATSPTPDNTSDTVISEEPLEPEAAPRLQKTPNVNELFWVAAYLFRVLLNIFLWAASPASSSAHTNERTPLLDEKQKSLSSSQSKPRLAFEVTGKYTLLVKSENVSRLLVLVDGIPSQALPRDIGGGHWLIDSDLPTDHARLEILLRV